MVYKNSALAKQKMNPEMEMGYKWFIRIVLAMKDYTGEGIAYGKSLENGKMDYIKNINGIARNGLLVSMLLHGPEFLNDINVNSAISQYKYRMIKKQSVGKFYDCLEIVNNVAIGLEFLSGSILFLNKAGYLDGVALFIVASILLIKPGIQRARRARIFLPGKNK